jgi:hypothetical protein
VVDGPVTDVPPAGARVDATPVVDPAPPAGVPEEFAVPALLVPGGVTVFEGLPAPLGSLSELLRPPTLAGPDGTPLTAAVPAPAEPALGEPAAEPVPVDAPLAAPPALPPVACANEFTGNMVTAITARTAGIEMLLIENSFFKFNGSRRYEFRAPERIQDLTIGVAPGKRACCAASEAALRKLIAFDDDTFDKLTQLGRDRMATLQELADEAFADLLKKHGVPVDLKDALRKSAGVAKQAKAAKTRSKDSNR